MAVLRAPSIESIQKQISDRKNLLNSARNTFKRRFKVEGDFSQLQEENCPNFIGQKFVHFRAFQHFKSKFKNYPEPVISSIAKTYSSNQFALDMGKVLGLKHLFEYKQDFYFDYNKIQSRYQILNQSV